MRTYAGAPGDHSVTVTTERADGTTRHRQLRLRLDLTNHSPTGFNWGYGGSGPAQLALALLADALGNDARALELHQHFKERVVARLAIDKAWTLSELDIVATVHSIEAELRL